MATSVIKKADGDASTQKPVIPVPLKLLAVTDPRLREDKSKQKEKKENEPSSADLFSAHDFDIKIDLGSATPNTALKLNLTPVGNLKPDRLLPLKRQKFS